MRSESSDTAERLTAMRRYPREPKLRGATKAKVENGQIVESTTEARAGETRGHMRWVLFLSTFAVAAIFAGMLTYFFA